MKIFSTLVISTLLAGLAAAQPTGPSLQVHSGSGSVNLGVGPDGRPGLTVGGQSGSIQLQGGNGASGRRWNNASLSRGPQGELILSDPQQGTIVVGRGPQEKTHIQTRRGSFSVDNSIVRQLLNGPERSLLEEQLAP